MDSQNTVIDAITYDSFGQVLSETAPSVGDRFKYTSREWDAETGQYYYRARYYGPDIGRFITQDPMGFAAQDPQGLRPIENIRSGEKVWSYDFQASKWTLSEVIQPLTRNYDGDLITIQVGDDNIGATGNHPFWAGPAHIKLCLL